MRVAAGIPFHATRGAGSHRTGPAASTCGERRRSTSAEGCRTRNRRGKVQEEDELTMAEMLPEHGSTSMNRSAPLWCLLLGTDRTSRCISWTSWTSATVGEGAARRRSCSDTWRWRFSGTLSCERDREDGERGNKSGRARGEEQLGFGSGCCF
jgi:hypothetical protein